MTNISYPIENMVSRIMLRYDRNKNKFIDLKGDDMSNHPVENSEKVVTDINNHVHKSNTYYFTEDRLNLGSLFNAADEDKNKFVSREEIRNKLKFFDYNNDNKLDYDERKDLSEFYPEVRTSQRFSLYKSFPNENPYAGVKDMGSIYGRDLTKSDKK